MDGMRSRKDFGKVRKVKPLRSVSPGFGVRQNSTENSVYMVLMVYTSSCSTQRLSFAITSLLMILVIANESMSEELGYRWHTVQAKT
jgi:hypothetical protein